MSKSERTSLWKSWYEEAWEASSEKQFALFDQLQKAHEKARKDNEDLRTSNRLSILKRNKIVACTTTGAAKMASLIKVSRLAVELRFRTSN